MNKVTECLGVRVNPLSPEAELEFRWWLCISSPLQALSGAAPPQGPMEAQQFGRTIRMPMATISLPKPHCRNTCPLRLMSGALRARLTLCRLFHSNMHKPSPLSSTHDEIKFLSSFILHPRDPLSLYPKKHIARYSPR